MLYPAELPGRADVGDACRRICGVWRVGERFESVSRMELQLLTIFDDDECSLYHPAHFVVGMGMYGIAGIFGVMPGEDVEKTLLAEGFVDFGFVGNVCVNDLSHCVF